MLGGLVFVVILAGLKGWHSVLEDLAVAVEGICGSCWGLDWDWEYLGWMLLQFCADLFARATFYGMLTGMLVGLGLELGS